MKKIYLFAVATSVVFALGCHKKEKTEVAAQCPAMKGSTAAPAQAAPTCNPAEMGVVKETMNASTYTYVKLQTATDTAEWAAGPTTVVKVGDTVCLENTSLMENFSSPTLKRTFATILFATAIIQKKDCTMGASGAACKEGSKSGCCPAMKMKKE